MSQAAAPTSSSTSHPTALWFIFWGEFAERCCYYGMRAILMLYLVRYLRLADEDANSTYSYYKMACYLFPLLGGFIADRFLGKYWTIVGFAVPYVIGQALLAFGDRSTLIFALGLLAFGSGVIKPNISSLLGMTYDQLRPGQEYLRFKAFQYFYFAINVGALLSMFALPLIRDAIQGDQPKDILLQTEEQKVRMGLAYSVAFSIPAALMFFSLILFAIGKQYYAVEKVHEPDPNESEQPGSTWKVIGPLLGVFLLYVLFWIPYEHNDTQWVLFANKYMLLELPWTGSDGTPAKISADAFQWINSLGVLILIPFFAWFWPKVDPTGRRISPIQKIALGLLFTATGPAVMTFCAWMASRGMTVSCLWLILAYFMLTTGEVLAYGTGLDFSYGQAPSKMKSQITACFLLTNAIGNFINASWGRNYDNPEAAFPMSPLAFFSVDMALPLTGAVLVLIVGRKFHQAHVSGTKPNVT
jgi:dipeptide/tripeptide permease